MSKKQTYVVTSSAKDKLPLQIEALSHYDMRLWHLQNVKTCKKRFAIYKNLLKGILF